MSVKQRGSAWSVKLVFSLYKLFGYNFIYYLLYFVTFFYFIFASNVKESLRIYYQHLGLKFTNKIYYSHLRIFAITMIDRFISKYDPASYTFYHKEEEKVQKILENKTILLLSHFGGWASTSNKSNINNKINIVMQESLLEGIKDIENSIENKKLDNKIIDISKGAIAVSVEIAQALSNNEIIAMMADRATSSKYEYEVNFFKKDAYFNENPFKIAYRTKTNILTYFAVYKKKQTYEVKSYILEIDYSLNEKDAIKKVIQEYALIFENILRQHENQWFNFYNFWEKR